MNFLIGRVSPGKRRLITKINARASMVLLLALLAGCTRDPRADPTDGAQVALGKTLYATHCAACHGAKLEGQANWQSRRPDGKLPAPPHDASGHTWHHDDETLLQITQTGLQQYAGANYQTDMPKFAGLLSDAQVLAILAYIKSSWPKDVAERQAALKRR